MFDILLGSDLLSAIVAFALVLIPAVFIHEVGHFLAAKAVGITILEFGIGLPPRMMKLFTWHGTEYTLNWLPLGGFVRPLGEDVIRPLNDEAVERDREEMAARTISSADITSQPPKMMSVNEAKPLARIFFMSAGAFANLLTAFVVFVIVGLTGIPQVVGSSIFVVEVDPNSPLAGAGLQANDVIQDLNGEKFSTPAEFMERLYALKGEPATLTVLRSSDGRFYDTTEELPFTWTTLQTSQPPVNSYILVIDIAPGSPADLAGIRSGDLIAQFNGLTLQSFEDLQQRVQQNLDKEITLDIERDGEVREVSLTPRKNPPEGEGAMGIVLSSLPAYGEVGSGIIYQEGFPQETYTPLNFTDSIQFSFNQIGLVINLIIDAPARIIQGTLSPEEARPVSPVGISQMGGMVLQQSIEEERALPILRYIAVISIALGITNLLPIPALDGGRIVFVVLEIIRGRPIPPEREGMVHLVGLMLLLLATGFFVLNDIINPITNTLR